MSADTYALVTRVKTRPGTPRTATLAVRLAGEGMAIAVVEATYRERTTCVRAGCKARARMGFLLARREQDGGGLVVVFACERHEPKKPDLDAGSWTP